MSAICGALGILGVTACTGTAGDSVSPPPPTTTSTTTTTAPRPLDGRLVIGALLPSTGGGAQFGSPLISAVRAAVETINEAGGVLGHPVQLIEADEGGSTATARTALDALISQGADAIIGPASSLTTLAVAAQAVSAGIPMCSPSATAIPLDEFPGNGLLFRTVPSDSLQAVAIATSAELTGTPRVAMAYIDDLYGRAFSKSVTDALNVRNLNLVDRVAVEPSDTDLADQIDELFANEPGVIIVLADADTGARILAAIGAHASTRRPTVPRIVVNDAVRMARASQLVRDLPTAVRSQVLGISPLAVPADQPDLSAPYAAHAHDCVNLIALAAHRAGSDDPSRIAAGIPGVSVGGSVCQTFTDCRARLETGLQIDYLGASGPLRLSARTGDPTVGLFQRFTFDADGRDVSGSVFEVSLVRTEGL